MTEDELFDKHPDGYVTLNLLKRLEKEGIHWTVLLDALVVHIQQDATAPVWLPEQLEKIMDQVEVDQS